MKNDEGGDLKNIHDSQVDTTEDEDDAWHTIELSSVVTTALCARCSSALQGLVFLTETNYFCNQIFHPAWFSQPVIFHAVWLQDRINTYSHTSTAIQALQYICSIGLA